MATSTMPPTPSMATIVVSPRTPKSTTPVPPSPSVTESPGNWRHPRLTEITQRRARSVFSQNNFSTILHNAIALVLLWTLHYVLTWADVARFTTDWMRKYVGLTYFILKLLPIFNIVVALLPLIRRPDDLSDIPLTPEQQKLLGLAPSSTPSTPSSTFNTPPRFKPTPSVFRLPASYSSSPRSNTGSPLSDRKASGQSNTFSPTNASPLIHRAMNGRRRDSSSSQVDLPNALDTLSPKRADGARTHSLSGGLRSSVTMNNKYLYDRGR